MQIYLFVQWFKKMIKRWIFFSFQFEFSWTNGSGRFFACFLLKETNTHHYHHRNEKYFLCYNERIIYKSITTKNRNQRKEEKKQEYFRLISGIVIAIREYVLLCRQGVSIINFLLLFFLTNHHVIDHYHGPPYCIVT